MTRQRRHKGFRDEHQDFEPGDIVKIPDGTEHPVYSLEEYENEEKGKTWIEIYVLMNQGNAKAPLGIICGFRADQLTLVRKKNAAATLMKEMKEALADEPDDR